jgi:hypothetical protein
MQSSALMTEAANAVRVNNATNYMADVFSLLQSDGLSVAWGLAAHNHNVFRPDAPKVVKQHRGYNSQ